MSEQELNSYRFISGDEPGDERLGQIMEEVTHEAMSRRRKADTIAIQNAKNCVFCYGKDGLNVLTTPLSDMN